MYLSAGQLLMINGAGGGGGERDHQSRGTAVPGWERAAMKSRPCSLHQAVGTEGGVQRRDEG
jgi:hypothetical protein